LRVFFAFFAFKSLPIDTLYSMLNLYLHASKNSRMDRDYKILLPNVIHAAEIACQEILSVYESGNFQAELKGDDSPLTLADKQAHDAITDILQSSDLPILSEEGKEIPYGERKSWEYFWLVDPLDGTKEFLKRNGEFTVNIALIHKNAPVLGVVAAPVTGDLFYGFNNNAFLRRKGVERRLNHRGRIDMKQSGLRVAASRSHMNEETQNFVTALDKPSLINSGSSLKFMLIAEGAADVYPRFAPTMEWDTAAAHAIINAVGLKVLQQGSTEELVYNKEDLVNPGFVVR
jgi:3'(2'), 5'-bisphosphate nucleotidase